MQSTGQIGIFKVISESSVAAGIRRIEALTGPKALEFFNQKIQELRKVETLVKNPDVVAGVEHLVKENQKIIKEIEKMQAVISASIKEQLKQSVQQFNGINYISGIVNLRSADALKDLSYQLKHDIKNLFLVLGANIDDKPLLAVMIDETLVKEKNLHAGNIIRELAKEIQGGGGGQPFFATAGGKNPEGLEKAVAKSKEMILKLN